MLKGILPLDRGRIPADILAGITLAALAIPEVMGYTKISGTPVITGLYTILIPAFLYALFGASRHLVVGADSATAAILASGLAAMSITDPADYLALSSVLALMSAALLLLARVLHLGFLANFLSRSVLIGFLTGVGIQVALGDFPGLFGIHAEGHGVTAKLSYFFSHLDEVNLLAVIISVLAIAAIVLSEKLRGHIPGALVVVCVAIFASWVFDFAGHGLTTLGPLPVGLPHLGLPEVSLTKSKIVELLPIAMSMFVVILAQSAATSRAYADRYNETYDADVDLLGLAAANIGAGLSGTFVVNGSPTKTEMLDSVGGRSQLAQIAAVLTVLAVLLFLTRPLAFLPQVVLSVIVFLIGIKLVDLRGMSELRKRAPREFIVAVLTALTVVFVGVKEGILLAVVLSLIDHLDRSYRPHCYVVVQKATSWEFIPVAQAREYAPELRPGLVIYHFTHSLYYANVAAFADAASAIETQLGGRLRQLCVEASAISDIDYSGAQQLLTLAARLRSNGVELLFCNVVPHTKAQMQRFGLVGHLGEAAFFDTAEQMISATAPQATQSG